MGSREKLNKFGIKLERGVGGLNFETLNLSLYGFTYYLKRCHCSAWVLPKKKVCEVGASLSRCPKGSAVVSPVIGVHWDLLAALRTPGKPPDHARVTFRPVLAILLSHIYEVLIVAEVSSD